MIISISGNIGAGKSTLSKALAKHYNCKLYEEPVDENPYLTEFYKDPTRYGIGMEIHLLIQRAREFDAANRVDFRDTPSAITDRIYYENRVFAEALYQNNIYREIEYQTYLDVEKELCCEPEDLSNVVVVYLKTDTKVLMKRIKNRGRECEKEIGSDYIDQLNDNYTKLFNSVRCIEIDNNEDRLLDYSDFVSEVVKKIDLEIAVRTQK